MPKQINVKLGFQADVRQAQQQIAQLQKSLDDLMSGSIKSSALNGFDKGVLQAQQSVLKLKTILDSSLNTDTGRLDLSKFNQQLNNSNLSLNKLAFDMNILGADGQKAFLNLANSIVTAQKPMIESNKLLDGMWTALKNTARWQLSSSILHGFIGSLQGAYGYAQDLNKSLNSIRIVSGQTTEQMAEFAEYANKSAQALSTSTLAYTDAALIFYQQGLRGEEVTQRVDTVLKLSNVTGESAEAVSSYMTAIWNNFDDGTQSLEHYADVITALGAATASSSEEIANGMQQFAAVADTVGLSYEYAATALATVVAQTRQSESTVGNAFRTIFSRLESLSLGESLEDGTDLTKYTKALETVGVNIKDQNGELKQMDDILDDIGERWQTLSREQQVALAQTVGGVRQYANLIALFDNWDKFQENLTVANTANGSLEEQAKIYEESWEAARKRVQAAWQALYQDLIDDKFFIALTDGIGNVLKVFDKLIDSIGGLPGLLATVSSIFTSVFSKKISTSLQNTQLQLSKILKPKGSNFTYAEIQNDKTVDDILEAARKQREKKLGSTELGDDAVIKNLDKQLELNKSLRTLRGQISDEEFSFYQKQIKETEEYAKQADTLSEILNTSKKERNSLRRKLQNKLELAENSGEHPESNMALAELFNSDFNDIIQLQGSQFDEAIEGILNGYRRVASELDISEDLLEKWVIKAAMAAKAQSELINTEKTQEYQENLLNAQLQIEKDLKKDKSNLDSLIINQTDQLTKSKKEEIKTTEDNIKKIDSEIEKIKELQIVQQKSPTLSKRQISNKKGQITKLKNVTEDLEKQNKDNQWRYEQALSGTSPMALNEKERLEKEIAITTETIKNNKEKIKVLEEEIKNASVQEGDIEEKIQEKEKERIAQAEKLKQLKKETQEMEDDLRKDLDKHFNPEPSSKENSQNLPFFLRPDFANGVTQATQGISQLTSAFTAFGTVWNTINNPDLSTWEKLTGVITSLTMAVPMLVAGFNSLVIAKVGDTGATVAQIVAQKLYNIVGKEVAATNIGIIASLGPIAIAIGVVIAAIWGLVKAWQMAYAASDKGKLEASNKKLEEQKEKANEAANAYNNLKSSVEGYNSALEKLNDSDSNLSERERQELVNETNKSIFEALKNTENWKTLLGEIHYDDNGLIELNKHQQDILLNDQYRISLLERQKEIQEEINNINLQQPVDYGDYGGPRFMKSGAMGAMTDKTLEIFNKLSENGITSLDQLGLEAGTEKLEKIFEDYSEADINWLVGKFEKLNEDEINAFEKFLEKRHDDQNQKLLLQEQEIREGFSDTLNQYDEASQEKIVERFGELDPGERQKALDNYLKGNWTILQALKNYDKQIDDLTLKPIEGSSAFDFTDVALDSDIKEEDLETLGKYLEKNAEYIAELDNELNSLDNASKKVASSILRFDDAIQDVTDHYEEWNSALETGNMQEKALAASQMADAFGDMLDLNGEQLSSEFLENAENLLLMKQAAEGVVGKYEELQERAREDLIAHLFIDGSQAEADAYKLNDTIQNAIGNIQIGALIDDAGVYEQMNQLINAVAMTADQAEDLLSSMGVDAEVETVTIDKKDKESFVNAIPNVINRKVNVPAIVQDLTGGNLIEREVNVPQIEYKPVPVTEIKNSTDTYNALRVKTARKSSGGNFKFNNSTHGAGVKGVGASSGGGKSSGSSKTPETKQPKEKVKNEDRYHDIKSQVDKLARAYERLNEKKNRAYGKAQLKYLDQEIDKTKEQIKLTEKYIDKTKDYLALDKGRLLGANVGAEFDEDGRLKNYEQVLDNITNTYNNAIDEYNDAIKVYNESAQEEADKSVLEEAEQKLTAAEKLYNANKEYLDQYEKTYETYEDQIDNWIKETNKLYDEMLEIVSTKVSLHLEINEADRKLLQFIYDNLGTSADAAADRISNLTKQTQSLEKDFETYLDGINGILGNHGINNFNLFSGSPEEIGDDLVSQLQGYMTENGLPSELTQAEAAEFREYADGLISTWQKMKQNADEVHQTVTDTFNDWDNRLSEQMNKYDQLASKLNHYRKIIDLTGKKMLGMSNSDIKKINNALIQNAQNTLASSKQIMDQYAHETDDAYKKWQYFLKKEDKISAEYWEKIYKDFSEKTKQATEDYYNNWEDALQKVNEKFDDSLEGMKEDYNNIFGNGGLDWMSEQFERQQDKDTWYLPDYKKYNELNKSANDLQKSIDQTSNTLVKGKMLDLMDEINEKRKEGVQISETDAGIIARRVALLQAEAELENAKNAKSAVRMTRDNEGNFSYTYTADQTAIDEAKQNYQDKWFEIMDYERQALENTQNTLIQLGIEYNEARAALMEKYKDDEETLKQKLVELDDYYNQKFEVNMAQLQRLLDEQGRLRTDDWELVEQLTGQKVATENDFIDKFGETNLALAGGYQERSEFERDWVDGSRLLHDESEQIVHDWQQDMRQTYQDAGSDVDNYKEDVNTSLGEIQEESNNTKTAVEEMVVGMNDSMDTAIEKASEFDDKYSKALEDVYNAVLQVVGAIDQMLEKLGDVTADGPDATDALRDQKDAVDDLKDAVDDLNSSLQTNQALGGAGGGEIGPYTGGIPEDNFTSYTVYYLSSTGKEYSNINYADAAGKQYGGTLYKRVYYAKGKYKDEKIGTYDIPSSPYVGGASRNPNAGNLNTNYSMQYASGGYTGNWHSSEGRLAVLHEKELVLNKEDTANMLKTIDLVRKINANMQFARLQSEFDMALMRNKLNGLNNTDTLEQQVHIEAVFPNVESHNEIEQAFNDLINSATQFVNRK